MILLVDAGNTRVKVGRLATDARLEVLGAAPWDGDGSSLETLLDSVTERPRAVLVSSVADRDPEARLRAVLDRQGWPAPRFVETAARASGVVCGYADFRELGVDRWLAMIAAHRRHADDLVVLSAGTAVTADFVTADGSHQGGIIVPGLRLMVQSLAGGTGRIGAVTAERPDPPPIAGRGTETAVLSGCWQALAGAATRFVTAAEAQAGGPVRLLVTGGDGDRLARLLGRPAERRPDLVLAGLAVWWQERGGSRP